MKILISSYNFYPDIGGIETISSILADQFVTIGHEVKLVTQTLANDPKNFPFEVIRQPSLQKLLNLVRWCDIFFHNNISLQSAWPLLLIRKPWIITHHTWITNMNGKSSWQAYLKHSIMRFATCISISQAIAEHLPGSSTVIGDPYRDDLFYDMPKIPRNKELVFLGRLVSDKGVDLLITALGKIAESRAFFLN